MSLHMRRTQYILIAILIIIIVGVLIWTGSNEDDPTPDDQPAVTSMVSTI